MGGSGGGGFFSGSATPDELARLTREAEESAHDEGFEIEVGNLLASELAEFNDRDVAGTQAVFRSVKQDWKTTSMERLICSSVGPSPSAHTSMVSAMWTR